MTRSCICKGRKTSLLGRKTHEAFPRFRICSNLFVDKSTKAVELATSLIQAQLLAVGQSLTLLSTTKNYFGLGYVLGMHDGVMQCFGIRQNSAEALTVFAMGFANLAKTPKKGADILLQCFDLQPNLEFGKGREGGAHEAFAFHENNVAPTGLKNNYQ